MSLKGKHVVLGVTGGIAAYKTPEVVRLLVQAEAEVRVVLTEAGAAFVTPLTLQTLSGHPVSRRTLDLTEESEIGHIRLADTADALLVAPATANLVAKLAAGIADDLLTTIALATRARILVAPAMNVHMYENPIVRENLARLTDRGVIVVEPDAGSLACGYEGAGRMPAPAILVEEVAVALGVKDCAGLRVLVSAGPTWEPLDPVRHLANRSSGKMGYALARAARRRGATVTLVSGPTALEAPRGIQHERVTTAGEMAEAVSRHAPASDVVVMAAAVGDFRPRERARHKIKRGRGSLELELLPNLDILAALRHVPGNRTVVGFAAETRNLVANARRKLQAKGVHLIVANDVTAPGAGFDADTNVVTLLDRAGGVERLARMSKDAVADAVLDRVVALRSGVRRRQATARRAAARRRRPSSRTAR